MGFKKRVSRVKVKIRRHRIKREDKKLRKLSLQRNKDLKEAARYAEQARIRDEAIQARLAKQKQRAPIIAARKERVVKVQKESQKAMNLLVKAVGAISKHANKPAKKRK